LLSEEGGTFAKEEVTDGPPHGDRSRKGGRINEWGGKGEKTKGRNQSDIVAPEK